MSEMVFRPARRRRRVSINLTSLIDVLFLLLIFFMLTSTFRQAGEMQLELPESTTSSPRETGQQLRPTEVVLRVDGTVLLDGQPMAGEELAAALRRRAEADPEARVLVNAEAATRHADVVRMIDLVRESGFAGLSLGTEMKPGTQEVEDARDPSRDGSTPREER